MAPKTWVQSASLEACRPKKVQELLLDDMLHTMQVAAIYRLIILAELHRNFRCHSNEWHPKCEICHSHLGALRSWAESQGICPLFVIKSISCQLGSPNLVFVGIFCSTLYLLTLCLQDFVQLTFGSKLFVFKIGKADCVCSSFIAITDFFSVNLLKALIVKQEALRTSQTAGYTLIDPHSALSAGFSL